MAWLTERQKHRPAMLAGRQARRPAMLATPGRRRCRPSLMPIDVMLAKGKMSVGEFAGRVGIASADRPQRPRRLVVPVR